MWSRSIIPVLTLSLLALPACAATAEVEAEAAPQSQSTSSTATMPRASLTQQERFNIWKSEFVREAITKGYDKDMVERLILPAKIEKRALARDKKQPEFSKPIWSYVDGAASATRLTFRTTHSL